MVFLTLEHQAFKIERIVCLHGASTEPRHNSLDIVCNSHLWGSTHHNRFPPCKHNKNIRTVGNMLASHTKGIKQHQSTHLPPPPKLSTPPGSTTGQNIQVKQHFTAKARTVRIKAKRLKHWHVYKKTNKREREFQHLLLLLVLLLSSFELMLIPDLSVDNSSYQAMNSRTMTTVYSLSADPCSGEGRGGAWGHRRCRTFAFVKGCSKTSHLLDCELWALCGTVGVWACGLGALARQVLFFLVARNYPSSPSNASTLANGSAILLDSARFRRSMDASDAPKPRTC